MDCLAKMLRFSPDGHHLISVGSGKSIIMDGKVGRPLTLTWTLTLTLILILTWTLPLILAQG